MDKKRMLVRAKAQIKALSPEDRRMWENLLRNHPWIVRPYSGATK
ncbi:MAG: hypothetical protein ACKPA7_34140 [Sphaerospermopsis kisseleviana]